MVTNDNFEYPDQPTKTEHNSILLSYKRLTYKQQYKLSSSNGEGEQFIKNNKLFNVDGKKTIDLATRNQKIVAALAAIFSQDNQPVVPARVNRLTRSVLLNPYLTCLLRRDLTSLTKIHRAFYFYFLQVILSGDGLFK